LKKPDFHRDNHYVPRLYLKYWESSPKQVWTYPIIVDHEKVPFWRERPTSGIAYHAHLYTRLVAGEESDEIERWLDQEYETPAEEAIKKATSDAQLTSADWTNLIRFLAAQDVRTPSRLLENLQRWQETLPSLMEDVLQETVQKLKIAKSEGRKLSATPTPFAEYFPLRVTTHFEDGQEIGELKAETISGRGAWLFSIRHLLTKTAKVLHQHRWTILSPPKDMTWFTSDDPVIRLNYNSTDNYDLRGGWASPGTEIMLPLGPRHLLYTQVGQRPPQKGSEFSRAQAELIRRFIAEHAHRTIFSAKQDMDVPRLRPRTVNPEYVKDERLQWEKWHEDQTAAEQSLLGWCENKELHNQGDHLIKDPSGDLPAR
jgi:hypothetical protein